MAGRAPDTLTRATAWTDQAACRFDDPDDYFDERSLAGLSCGVCPVRETCLAEALAAEGNAGPDERFGIYGGLTSKERAALAFNGGVQRRRHSGGRPLAPCGTEAAYNRHCRNGEPIDDACRRAHTQYARARQPVARSGAAG